MSERTDDQKNKDDKDHVVDFKKAREQKLEEKRRKTERVFFKQMLGIYCVVGNEEMKAIEIVDVSEEGLSFRIPHSTESDWPDRTEEVLPLRLYFSQDTYLPLHLFIQNSRPSIDEGVRYVQYGCKIDKTLTSYSAYREFVKFLKLYSEHAHKDVGGMTLFYL